MERNKSGRRKEKGREEDRKVGKEDVRKNGETELLACGL